MRTSWGASRLHTQLPSRLGFCMLLCLHGEAISTKTELQAKMTCMLTKHMLLWVPQGILLTDGERLNSLSLLACMSSIAVLLLLPVMLLLEPLAPSTAYRLATSGQCESLHAASCLGVLQRTNACRHAWTRSAGTRLCLCALGPYSSARPGFPTLSDLLGEIVLAKKLRLAHV